MANATYILGSNQYVVVELERTALSDDFTPANWTYRLALVPFGETLDVTTADWVAAVYELATDSEGATHHTLKALLPTLTTVRGKFSAAVEMTSLTETETPTYPDVAGLVTVK